MDVLGCPQQVWPYNDVVLRIISLEEEIDYHRLVYVHSYTAVTQSI